MHAQNGVQADLTSPDRHHHFLAPAASDAPPHWSEQKLIHRQAKDALQGRSLPAGPATVRQKLFGNTLRGFAAAEHQLHKAYPASGSVSPARLPGLITANSQAALANETKAVQGSKRKDCMDHFVSKKPRHSSDSNRNKMPFKMAFDAAEKLMQNMCTRTSAAAEE
ncbi:MAG: hypothetical protein FRX49_03939 [Trebouxia sp. A1-2]|nr:MAG: hypothetical protein FRX49_03939 [Trebouxia sp. A1-2]